MIDPSGSAQYIDVTGLEANAHKDDRLLSRAHLLGDARKLLDKLLLSATTLANLPNRPYAQPPKPPPAS